MQLPTCWSFFCSIYRDPFLCIFDIHSVIGFMDTAEYSKGIPRALWWLLQYMLLFRGLFLMRIIYSNRMAKVCCRTWRVEIHQEVSQRNNNNNTTTYSNECIIIMSSTKELRPQNERTEEISLLCVC